VRLRNASIDEEFEQVLTAGDEVRVDIEDLPAIAGNVVRITDPMIAITFPDQDETHREEFLAGLMARQGLFGLQDPETVIGA